MHCRLLPIVFVAAVANLAPAQAQWTLLSPPTSPAARLGAALAFDATTQRSFLFGGAVNGGMGDAQMWNGAAWATSTVSATSFLWSRRDCGFVDDGAGAMLLFGGWRPGIGFGGGQPAVLDETWRVTATAGGAMTFTLLAPPVRPAARQGLAMVRTNQGVLLFGGSALATNAVYGDTWRWNGTTWTQLAGGPSPRTNAALAFDAGRNVAVLFGGFDGNGQGLADTWEFDGTTWQQRVVSPSPSGRAYATFVWSPVAARALLFGGLVTYATGPGLGDAWAWNGSQWTQQVALGAPTIRSQESATWDPVTQRVLTFGGFGATGFSNETHHVELSPSTASYTLFGGGCPGPTAQVPSLTVLPGELPALGTTSHFVVSNLPVGLTLPVFALGTSNVYEPNPGYPLPIDLGFVGWPGCAQLVSHDVLQAVPTLTGSASIPFAVPMSAVFLGFTIHAQALVLLQPSGVAVSNAITGVVGS